MTLQLHVHAGGDNLLGYFEHGVKKSAKSWLPSKKQAQKKRRRGSADSLSTVAYNKFVTGSQSVIPLQYVTNFKSWGMI
jgi:hypothetical protein